MDYRSVEEEGTDVALHRFGLAGGHAEKHLELDARGDTARFAQEVGEGDVEQVVAGNTDADVTDALRGQRVVDDRLIGGVGVLLGAPGRQRPAVQVGVDLFHRQVGALHDADLDRCAAVCGPGCCPFLEAHHGAECIRQIGLEDDAGFQVVELRLLEQTGEDSDGQVEVLVFLHVQVDELAG